MLTTTSWAVAIVVGAVSAVVAGTATHAQAATGATAATAPSCASLTSPVYQRVNPTTRANLLTRNASEAASAAAGYGFTQDRGTPFAAAAAPTTGTVAVHRLYQNASHDFTWMKEGAGLQSAVAKRGYVDQGVDFYLATRSGSGCIPIYRLLKAGIHRFALAVDVSALTGNGWKNEGVFFYGSPGGGAPTGSGGGAGSRFSLAVLPDTQNWVTHGGGDPRMADATAYLASVKSSTNLKEVLQTGDLVNWGWLDNSQLSVASSAFANLENAGLPYLLTVGNHDTRAVGVGGSAYVDQNGGQDCVDRFGAPACTTPQLVRHTEELNAVFDASREGAVAGQFEAGKVDNSFNTFSAGGRSWLTLSLEFCPRTDVVGWARQVVAEHPDDNVIVETHYYLNGDSTIGTNAQGYGASSPQYLYDNLISRYPNIKLVFSGHTGEVGYREDTGVQGNKIASMSFNDLGEDQSNAIRLVDIDASTGAVHSRLYAHNLDRSYPEYDRDVTLSFR